MVEIHEPVRILFVIETTPEIMAKVIAREADTGRLICNGWVQLALLDPTSRTIKSFHNGTFQDYQPQTTELPRASSSVDWYRGWRDHLEFAVIGE
jgi:hypothetical protein